MKRTQPKGLLRMGAALLMTLALLTACAAPGTDQMAADTAETQAAQATAPETIDKAEDIQVITAQKAKQIIDNEQSVTIVDVREPDEFSEGHIEGAKLLPLGSLKKLAPTELPELDATILVYCRSGARSSMGASVLASMGYTHVLDMGGVLSWPFGLVR